MSERRLAGRSGLRGRAGQWSTPVRDEPAPTNPSAAQARSEVVRPPSARSARGTPAARVQGRTEGTRRGADQDERQGLAADGLDARIAEYGVAPDQQHGPAITGLSADRIERRELVGFVGVGVVG